MTSTIDCATQCIICLNKLGINEELWICGECNINLHKKCFEEWQRYNNSCPHCKTPNDTSPVEIVETNRIVIRRFNRRRQLNIVQFKIIIMLFMSCLCYLGLGAVCVIIFPFIFNFPAYNNTY